MNADAIEREWEQHELQMDDFLYKREKINEIASTFLAGRGGYEDTVRRQQGTGGQPPCTATGEQPRQNAPVETFEDFWARVGEWHKNSGLFCFFVGTALMYVATALFMAQTYRIQYQSLAGVYVSFTVMMVSLGIGLILAFYLRFLDSAQRADLEFAGPRETPTAAGTETVRWQGFVKLPPFPSFRSCTSFPIYPSLSGASRRRRWWNSRDTSRAAMSPAGEDAEGMGDGYTPSESSDPSDTSIGLSIDPLVSFVATEQRRQDSGPQLEPDMPPMSSRLHGPHRIAFAAPSRLFPPSATKQTGSLYRATISMNAHI